MSEQKTVSAPPAAADAKALLTMRIRYERVGRCFWHQHCAAQRHAPPMKIERDDRDGKRTLLRCTACDRAGWYPHGSVGDVCCEEERGAPPAAQSKEQAMPYVHEIAARMKALAEAPTLGNLHPDDRLQAIARAGINPDELTLAVERLRWLHSPASSCDAEGYEWGIFRVKWGASGEVTEMWHTFSDFSDLDDAMAASPSSPKEPGEQRCPGRPDSRCDYLAACGQVCSKCGKVHNGYAALAVQAGTSTAPEVPTDAIGRVLQEVMERAVANGANSVSMPDDYVAIAAWLASLSASPSPQE